MLDLVVSASLLKSHIIYPYHPFEVTKTPLIYPVGKPFEGTAFPVLFLKAMKINYAA